MVDAEELTATEAAREFEIDERTLRDGATHVREGMTVPVLRSYLVDRPKHPQMRVFVRGELREDLAKCPCSYPCCGAPAPGRSGRCGKHRARGVPAVELICQRCGETFLRPQSWLDGLEGRGHYCSNRCKGLGTADVDRLRDRSKLGGQRASEHHRRVSDEIIARGLMDTAAMSMQTATSPSVIRATGPALGLGELQVIDGSPRLVYGPEDDATYLRARARSGGEHYLQPQFAEKQQRGRLRALVDAGLTEPDALAVIRGRAEARRKLIANHRRGRPRSSDLHSGWHQLFETFRREFEAEGQEIVLWHVALAVAECDFAENRSRWPGYRCSPNDPQSLHPEDARKAALRVWKAVKPLLTAAY